MSNNIIQDITKVSYLFKLKELDISRNHITKILDLSSLSNLNFLNLGFNFIDASLNIKEEDIEKLNNTIKVDIINKDEVTDKDAIIDKNNIINKNDNVKGEGDLENDNKVNKEYTIYIFLMSLVSAAGIISILSIKRRKYK